MQIDRGLAGSLGITVGQVAQALRPAFAGIDVGDWVDPSGETRDVTVRLAPEVAHARRRSGVAAAVGAGPDGRAVSMPLGQVARDRAGIGPARIDHLDRDRVITVEANTEGRPLGEVIDDIDAQLTRT